MSTSIKISRPNRLSEDETLTTFEDWRNNLIFYLNQDKDFQPLLVSTATWTVKNSTTEHRGRASAAECQHLEHFLGIIASLAPPLLHGDIIEETTKLSDVFKILRTYYQFAPSESTFLKFSAIKREVSNGTLERPLHLYLRMRQFIRDNLLLSSGKIQHDGTIPSADEKLSPTTERLIVLRWLEVLHSGLPNLVANIFAQDLQTKSLKDLQPRIAQQIDDLLFQLDSKDNVDVSYSTVDNVDVSYSKFTNRPGSYHNRGGNFNQPRNRFPFTDQRKSNFDGRDSDSSRRNWQRRKASGLLKCEACRSVGEPFIGHSIDTCRNIAPGDRASVVKSFSLEVGDEYTPDEINVDGGEVDSRCARLWAAEGPATDVRRVDIVDSPKFNVKINNTMVSMVLDTGATGSMISLDLCRLAKLDILPSNHSAILADGDSRLTVVGEVHTSIVMQDGLKLSLNALVVSKLEAGLIVGMAFMKEHSVIIDISENFLIIQRRKVPFSNQPGNPKVSLLRINVNNVILPGESINVVVPENFIQERDLAIEPREDISWLIPDIVSPEKGVVAISNDSDHPVRLKKHQVIGQVRSVVTPNIEPLITREKVSAKNLDKSDQSIHISVNPDNVITSKEASSFKDINAKYKAVFNSLYGTYNGKSGDIKASVILGKTLPSPKKGRVPSYSSDKAKILQDKFDQLVAQGVLSRPEDNDVTVIHTSPSFLVKKPDKSYRLVTSFVELNKYVCSLPTRMFTTEDVITQLGKWKHIIKTDLKSAYFQIEMDRTSQQWLGTISPYKGLYVYNRAAMGLKNMAEFLEEVVARVLGSCLAEGYVTKIADDLIIGGNTVEELLNNWSNVLQKLHDNNLSLSAAKTVICPASITVIGWLWKQGKLEVDPHRINPLSVCQPPKNVKGIRSFIGAVRAFSRCYPSYSRYLTPLEEAAAGKESSDAIVWNENLTKSFAQVQEMLRNPKILTLPHPSDQLVLVSDGCNSPAAVGSTLYVKRGDKLFPSGFFSAKLKKHQIQWLPCEIEAVGINLSISHFANFIRESKNETKFLTDSKTCVQAFNKMSCGGFSLSPRISSFLLNLNSLNISIHHIRGSSIKLTDFSSRHPIECSDNSCQLCQFVADQLDIAVRALNVEDIERGVSLMPFYNMASWKEAQMADKQLNRLYSQLSSGTRPGRKEQNLGILRRYFQIASISTTGVLIYRKRNPYGRDFELIIIPQDLVTGLIAALHIRLNHPTKGQLKKLFDRYFFALNSNEIIDDCTNSCFLCTSLKRLPAEAFQQSTSEGPDAVGKTFSADVIRREHQKILIVMDIFSSFLHGALISNEQHETLQQGLIQLSADYKHSEGCTIRVDNASGFVRLKNDRLLASVGIKLDFGRVKNKNKNPTVDRGIQDVESEIKRLSPEGGQISPGTLAIAISYVNSRIRDSGLSAKEIITKRDSITNEPLQIDDKQLQNLQYERRIKNHRYSEKSKAKGKALASAAFVSKGDIVHIKGEGTKHTVRDYYLIVDLCHESGEATIQKFHGNRIQSKKWLVKLDEIYPAATSVRPQRLEEGEVDTDLQEETDIPLLKTNDIDSNESSTSDVPELRRSSRIRNRPQWLATDEIQRVSNSKSGEDEEEGDASSSS